MLSATSEYALRAVLMLACEYGRRPLRADEIADAVGAPRNYMAKTLNALVKNGMATSARGPQGGFQLALPPEKITVAEVIDCFDEPRRRQRCLLGNARCNSDNPCAAHFRWTAITAARREPLTSTTLADLLGDLPIDYEPKSTRIESHAAHTY